MFARPRNQVGSGGISNVASSCSSSTRHDETYRDEEDIFPDPLAETVGGAWRAGGMKALEGQFASLASAVPAA